MKILIEHRVFEEVVKYLKAKSPYYPEVLFYYEYPEVEEVKESKLRAKLRSLIPAILKREVKIPPYKCYATTMVRIERGGKWYKIHVVESMLNGVDVNLEKALLLKLMDSVYKLILFYPEVGANQDDIDPNQIPEEVRLFPNQLQRN